MLRCCSCSGDCGSGSGDGGVESLIESLHLLEPLERVECSKVNSGQYWGVLLLNIVIDVVCYRFYCLDENCVEKN